MHNFTEKDVLDPGFNLSLLRFSEEDIQACRSMITSIYEDILRSNREIWPSTHYYHNHVSQADVLKKIDISQSAALSFIFIPGLMQECTKNTPVKETPAFFVYKIKEIIYSMPKLAGRIFSDSPYITFTSDAFSSGLVDKSFAYQVIKSRNDSGTNLIYEYNLLTLLDAISPEDSKIFLNSHYDKVRLSTYKKLGCLEYIDQMLLDKSAEVRRCAADSMSYGDPRFKTLIKEKTKGVLFVAITKSPEGILPLFLSNSLVKKDYDIKSVFESRMGK